MWKEVGGDDRCFKSDLVFRDLNEVGLEFVVNVSVEACSDTLERIFTAEWLRQEMPKWTEHGDDYKYGEFDPLNVACGLQEWRPCGIYHISIRA